MRFMGAKNNDDRLARKYRISGRVQGVGFRYFAERVAKGLGLAGYVMNCDDGTVEVYAAGDEAALGQLKLRLAEGPRSALVSRVEEWDEAVNDRYHGFVIKGGW
jgi:acylphosphatase